MATLNSVAADFDSSATRMNKTIAGLQVSASSLLKTLGGAVLDFAGDLVQTAAELSRKSEETGIAVEKLSDIIPPEFAKKAQEYEDSIKQINNTMQSFIANNQSSSTFLDITQVAMKGAAHVAIGLSAGLEELGMQIGAYGAAAMAVVRGNFSEAKTIIQEYHKDYEATNARMEEAQKKLWTELPKEVKKGVSGAGKELKPLKLNTEPTDKSSGEPAKPETEQDFITAVANRESPDKTRGPMQQLAEDWANTTKQMEQASAGWANTTADLLTELVMTGKTSFNDLFRSILQGLIKIQIQKALSGLVGSIGGFFSGSGRSVPQTVGMAMGGEVSGGTPYIVGERGPELFVPSQSGTIIPNGELTGQSIMVNNTWNISTGVQETVRAEIISMMPQITAQTKAGVQSAIERGGSMSRSVGRRQ